MGQEAGWRPPEGIYTGGREVQSGDRRRRGSATVRADGTGAAKGQGAALLRRALLLYPQDFWLHFTLGNIVADPGEKVGWNRAALAVRPDSTPAYNNLGIALQDMKDLDGAIQHYRKAIAL